MSCHTFVLALLSIAFDRIWSCLPKQLVANDIKVVVALESISKFDGAEA